MKDSTLKFVLVLIIGLLVWLLLSKQGRIGSLQKTLHNSEIQNKEFIEFIDKQNVKYIEQKQTILSQKDAINTGLLELQYWKTVKSKVEYKYETIIDSIYIAFSDTIYLSDTIYPKGFIEVPKRFKMDSSDCFKINGLVTMDGVNIDSLFIYNKINITIGEKKNGLFKKNEQIVKVENSNPFIKTIGVSNIVIENDKNFYQRGSFWLGVGSLGGYILKSNLSK